MGINLKFTEDSSLEKKNIIQQYAYIEVYFSNSQKK